MQRREIALPIIALALVAIGLFALSSVAPDNEFRRQLTFLALALPSCGLVLWLGQRRIMPYSWYIYWVTLALLLATQIFGTTVNGAKSWLYIGPLPGFQPSELAKLSLILSLATLLHKNAIRRPWHYIRPAILIILPFAFTFIQPDLGSALVIAAIGGGMLLMRGVPTWHVIAVIIVMVVAVPTVVYPNLEPHQITRIRTFLNPSEDPEGAGYQVIQARIAIGSGGIGGKGYKQGSQSQLGFIPYHHTDFIFAPVAEEGGFILASLLLLLYGLLFWRLVMMAAECRHIRDQLLIAGVMVFIAFQVLVNIGVTLGLAPVTGITLPLISYGGTSLLSTLVALSFAYMVHRDRFEEW